MVTYMSDHARPYLGSLYGLRRRRIRSARFTTWSPHAIRSSWHLGCFETVRQRVSSLATERTSVAHFVKGLHWQSRGIEMCGWKADDRNYVMTRCGLIISASATMPPTRLARRGSRL